MGAVNCLIYNLHTHFCHLISSPTRPSYTTILLFIYILVYHIPPQLSNFTHKTDLCGVLYLFAMFTLNNFTVDASVLFQGGLCARALSGGGRAYDK